MVMFGDHKQLPPTLMSERAGKGGLAMSLFERLAIRGFPVNLLSIQYRMLPGKGREREEREERKGKREEEGDRMVMWG